MLPPYFIGKMFGIGQTENISVFQNKTRRTDGKKLSHHSKRIGRVMVPPELRSFWTISWCITSSAGFYVLCGRRHTVAVWRTSFWTCVCPGLLVSNEVLLKASALKAGHFGFSLKKVMNRIFRPSLDVVKPFYLLRAAALTDRLSNLVKTRPLVVICIAQAVIKDWAAEVVNVQ